jgi:octaprenyl-diphosphate synthase
VLVGDFIYSRAFQILVDIGDLRVMEIIANTTNKIAEGEVLQLIAKNNPNSSEQNYLQVIKNKTAILFQAAAQCGAILGQADITTEKSLQHYGMHIGIAFQLIDDVLDYDGDTQTMGKNIGDDLAEGKPTLPLIYAMEKGDNDQSRKIKEVLQQKNVSEKVLHEVIQIVRESGALDYTRKLARQQAGRDGQSQIHREISFSRGTDINGEILFTSQQLILQPATWRDSLAPHLLLELPSVYSGLDL